MISLIAYNSRKNESDLLHVVTKNIAADISDEMWNMNFCIEKEKALAVFESGDITDLFYCDVTTKEMLHKLPEIRKKQKQMGLLLIGDTSISPVEYMKPSIKADSLLLRPFSKEDANYVVKDFVEHYLSQFEDEKATKTFVIESREGKTYLSIDDIFYFESKNKKIYARTKNKEYGFYSTIETILSEVPDYFLQSHRSFLVNKKKIQKVNVSSNEIELTEGLSVPLSRSYKPDFRKL